MDPKKATTITAEATRIPYSDTGCFNDIVLDYLGHRSTLSGFYNYEPTVENIKAAIHDRKDFPYQREALVAALRQQYSSVEMHTPVARNIDLLLSKNTYVITTAHQPNIFTGPLYFVYKILHAIKLADTLSKELHSYQFVPVFFMGSEDADLDELGQIVVDGKKYEWKTKQTGAVGRMKVDKAFIALMDELGAQIGVLPHGGELVNTFRNCYTEGKPIQRCTLELVNTLFGKYGLVVLIPDDPTIKKLFAPVVRKELTEQFSHKAVELTAGALSKHYKVQAGGRNLNLFYLLDDKRERIEFDAKGYSVTSLGLRFSEAEILCELDDHPERFSPNVILRGVLQEMILPGIAFIGGGGEIAYWLELKSVFREAGVEYPVLVLRNSFMLMRQAQATLMEELGLSVSDLFKGQDYLLNLVTRRESARQLSLSEETGEMNLFYQQLHDIASSVDPTLGDHVNMLQAKALKRIIELEKKMLRAEKKKFETERRKIVKLKEAVFPGGNLQERVENISAFYGRNGMSLMDKLLTHSLSLEQEFTVVVI